MSRYPTMSQPAYDRSLLAAAPSLTRADRQAGYDVNALEQGQYYTSSGPPPRPAPAAPAVDPFADQQQYYEPQPSPEPIPPKKPWYKTTRGRWLIVLGIIILVGLIAGIAAGTASARQSHNTTLLSNNGNNDSQDQDQNTGGAATNSPTDSPFAPVPTSSNADSPASTPVNQNPTAATLTFGNGNGNGNGNGYGNGNQATQTTPSSNQPTTIIFGGSSQPAVIAPTQVAGNGSDNGNDGTDIPTICYTFPTLRECLPYFENGP